MKMNSKFPFLENLALYILEFYNHKTNDLLIILPNRRGRIFLINYLKKHLNSTFIVPQIKSIEDFVFDVSETIKTDNLELLFEFYNKYKLTETGTIQSFEEFAGWANVLLTDFNELDAYHVDAKQFFGYLNEERALKEWSPDRPELTEFQKQYLKFWKSLPEYYEHIQNYCIENGKAYQGFAYKLASEKIIENNFIYSNKKIIFAGFNALSGCEEQLINVLVKRNQAEILFDADEYYLNDKVKEAGRSLRRHFNNPYFKNINTLEYSWKSKNFIDIEKNITLIPCSKNISQVKIAADLLNQNYNPEAGSNWCYVLADESLLIPAINALPEKVSNVNISMGYPVKASPLFAFIINYLQLISNTRKFKNEPKFYTKTLLDFILKPQFLYLINGNKKMISKLKQHLLKENFLFTGINDLKEIIHAEYPDEFEVISKLLITEENKSGFDYVITVCEKLRNKIKNDAILQTFNEEFLKLLYKTKQSSLNANITLTPQQVLTTLKQLASQISIPFIGEPLNGLQITGMLETRTLDFENVIITSLNEGSLPAGKKQNTFIPFEIKRVFGLPTYNDKDAIFSYHFYRLLSRAKNIYLLYNDDTDSVKSSEKSRFIEQLKFEIPAYNPKINIETKSYSTVFPEPKDYHGIEEITKEAWIIDAIKNKFEKGISPSSLNIYRSCKIKFYLSEIVKIKEDEELEEEIDAAGFGNIVHEVLEKCFKPFLNITIEEAHIPLIFNKKEVYLKEAFHNHFGKKNEISGKNLILYKVILRLLNNYEIQFKQQIVKEKIIVTSLEESISHIITVNHLNVNLYGKADRIELWNGVPRIIDYKTGKTDIKELAFNVPEDFSNPDKNKGFQLFYYAYIHYKQNGNKSPGACGIISFKDLKYGVKMLHHQNNFILKAEDFQLFEEYLHSLLNEILNPNVNFIKTENIKECNYCNYKNICNRA